MTPAARARFGTMLAELSSPNVSRLLGRAGFDFVIIDCEHGPFNRETVGGIIAGARPPAEVYVRVPGVDRAAITAYLDMGAAGLVVPMVSTVEEAQLVARFSKYPPVGRRGVSTVRAHTSYGVDDLEAYQSRANVHVKSYVQIETDAGVAVADEIAAVDGIDGLLVGPSDLASDGARLGLDSTETVENAVRAVATAARRAGKESGVITSSSSLLSLGAREGMTIFGVGSELHLVLGGATSLLGDARAACRSGFSQPSRDR